MGNTCSCCSNGMPFPEAEVVSYLNQGISFIETRLDAIRIEKRDEGTSGAETIDNSSAGVVFFIKHGFDFLDDIVRRVRSHTCKIVKRNSDIQKAVTDILKGAEQVQWNGAGVAVVAYVLDQVKKGKFSTDVWDECVEFLRFMCGLAKYINQPVKPLTDEELAEVVVFIVKGSFFCLSRMQPSSNFSALVSEEEIRRLQSELTTKYPELGHDQHPDEDVKPIAVDFSVSSGLDELMSYIEKRLAKPAATDKAEDSASLVGSSIKYGSDLLTNVLERCGKRRIQISDTRKLVIDVLKEASQIHWVAAGLSVVAYVLQKVDDASTNKEECVEFLTHMYHLAKHIKGLEEHITEKTLLEDVTEFIFKGSFFCVSRIQSTNLSRFFSSVVDVQEIKHLQSQLGHKYQDLILEAETQVLKDVAEVSSKIPDVLHSSQGKRPEAVGIDKSVSEVKHLLGMDDEKYVSTRAVVIYGVGGMGKTTLAKAVFSSLDLKGYKFCRLIIEQDCSDDDLLKLQKQILNDLFGKRLEFPNCEMGKEEIYNAFTKEAGKLFLFIDNALKGDDLAKILPEDLSCMPKRSKMLVTTRKLDETDMLNQPDNITRLPYPIKILPPAEAKELFSRKALGCPDGIFDATSDIDGLLNVCGGIPLVLHLVGTRLSKHHNNLPAFNSTIEEFKDSLEKGKGELTDKVVDVVYHSLQNDRYEDAFLDIAAFFSSWEGQTVRYIVGADEVLALEEAALIKISDGKVELHDVVLKRGRKLSESNRITDLQSPTDIIDDTERLENVKGIYLPWKFEPTFQLPAELLDKMHKCLRVLIISGSVEVTGACTKKFENLRYLKVTYGNSPLELNKLPRLAIFKGHIRSDDKLRNLPQSLRRLEVDKLESLGLDESFGKLSRLEELDISQNKLYMTKLPQSFGQLESLQCLNLSSLEKLTSLPDTFDQLSNLRELRIWDCSELSSLSDDFGHLKSLKELKIEYCQSLKKLSDTFGQLSNLKKLDIDNCTNLSSLCDNFGQLKSLQDLTITCCKRLQRLSDDFGSLTTVTSINASDCPILEGKAVDQMIELKSLIVLDISESPLLIDRWQKVEDGHPQLVLTGEESVQDVLTQRKKFNAVGIDEARDEVIKLLDLEDELTVRAVVLYGVAGIGKTTLATAVFYYLPPEARGRICRMIDMSFELRRMQRETSQWSPKILFVDDANLSRSDLARFLPEDLSRLRKGSRILITTRKLDETEVIKERGVECYIPYRVKGLSEEDSKKFLCLKALGSVDKSFDQSLDIDGLLKICGGNPWMLEMVASKLRKLGNDVRSSESTIELFKDTLSKGEGDLREKVVDVLYNTLQENLYKDAFIDIAAFFNNWKQRTVGYIVGEAAVKAIEEAGLVEISERGRVIVNNNIVLARGKKLPKEDRITDQQSLRRALQHPQRLEKLKGIHLVREYADEDTENSSDDDDTENSSDDDDTKSSDDDGDEPKFPSPVEPEFELKAKHLDEMHKCLRVLILSARSKVTGACTKKFENLRYLKINNGYSSPMELNKLPSLAVFEGRIRSDDSFGNLPHSLRRLKVDALKSLGLDESFGKLSRLEELDISQNEHYMRELPQSFGHLKSLHCLKLSCFRELTSLPDTFGQLSNLEELNISDCTNLSRLSDNFGTLSKLKTLKIINCTNLHNLSDDFGELNNLKKLVIVNCTNLAGLPDGFGQLSNLKKLVIVNCTNLARLSDGFGQLSNLKKLVIVNCTNLCSLSHRFGQLKSLEYLIIRGCRSLRRLSDDFGSLTCVTAIDSSGCPALEEKAVDQMIELKSLLVLNILESHLLIKRWEEIKEGQSLLVRTESRDNFFRYSISRTLCDAESRFVNVDGVGRDWSSAFPAGEVKIAFLLMCCDICSPSSDKDREMVAELADPADSEGFRHIIYVCLMEQSEESIVKTLRRLSQGISGSDSVSLCAWIPPPSRYKWKELFVFSACMILVSDEMFGSTVWKANAFIAEADISVSEPGKPQVQDLELTFPELWDEDEGDATTDLGGRFSSLCSRSFCSCAL